MAREVNQLLGRVFAQRRNHGRTDLEAIESALRVVLHQAGAAALSELLQYEAPDPDQRQLPCPCGQHAQYQGLRTKPVLTAGRRMGDGAEWIWNLAEQHFPGAVQIVDLYHARQHLWELVRKLHPNEEVNQKA